MKKTKKKHRIKSFLVIILFVYLIAMIGYYVFNLSVKNIYVIGNEYISDLKIIEEAGLKNYPPIIKVNPSKIKNKLLKLDLIESVKVRRNILGKVTITVTENKPLFYYRNDNLVYLSNGKSIKDDNSFLGIPYLINYVPKELLKEFITKLTKIDYSIVKMISEIEYDPDKKEDTLIDETRFLLRMNDGNIVYVNTINLKRLNEYEKIYATIDENLKGILYLNSNRENVSFTSFDSIKQKEEQDKLKEEKKKNEDEN